MGLVGEIDKLWRYPVKSLLGESCTELHINQRGVIGDEPKAPLRDHWFAICDLKGKFGSGKDTRRFRKLTPPTVKIKNF